VTRLFPPLAGVHRADVLVVGGGLAGCAAAYELAARGLKVVLLEPDRLGWSPPEALGHLATGPALSYRDAVTRLGREGALEAWEAYREGHRRTRELLSTLGREHGYRNDGGFVLAEDRPQGIALAESEDALRDDGFPGEFLDHYMLEARFDVTGFSAGYWALDDGIVDGPALVRDLAARAADGGARICETSPVLALEAGSGGVEAACPEGGIRASWALVAHERAAASLVTALAGRVDEWTQERLDLSARPGALLPTPARSLGGLGWRVRDGEVLLARSAGSTAPGDATSGLPVFAKLRGVAPGTRYRSTATTSRDGLPLVGPVRDAPLAVACAFGGSGLGIAVLAASWAVEALTTGRDPTPPLFRANRG